MTFNNESIEYGIARHAAVDPNYRRSARTLTATWLNKLKADKTSTIPGLTSAGNTAQTTAVANLNGDLTTGELPKTEINSVDGTATTPPQGRTDPGSTSTSDSSARAQTSAASTPAQPNTFPVRGNAGSGRSFWTNMQEIVAAHFCGTGGCGSDTDRYTSKITITPSASTSMIASSNLYFPSTGSFGNKHFQLWSINRGSVVGTDNTGNLPNASRNYLANARNLNSTMITVAVELWVYAIPYGTYVADGAKTADATCGAPGNNACRY